MPVTKKKNLSAGNRTATAPSSNLNMASFFLPKIRKIKAVHSKNPYKMNIKPPLPPELKYK
jgi:hypothetical protein